MRKYLFPALLLLLLLGTLQVAARAPRKRLESEPSGAVTSHITSCACTTTVTVFGKSASSGSHNSSSGHGSSGTHSSSASGPKSTGNPMFGGSTSGSGAHPGSSPMPTGTNTLRPTSPSASLHSGSLSTSASQSSPVTVGDNDDNCDPWDPPYSKCSKSKASHTSMQTHSSSGPSSSHAPSPSPRPSNSTNHTIGAVYFLSNKPKNSIVVLDININGSLTFANEIPIGEETSGKSSGSGNNMTVPALSQDSVLRLSHYLFVVNTANDSLSVFDIDPHDPSKLSHIKGSPISSMGKYPVSVAFARTRHTVCVLNGGGNANIACFHVNQLNGIIPLEDTKRDLNVMIDDRPSSKDNTFGDIIFNPDETKLVVSQRGDRTNHVPGQIEVFKVLNSTSPADGNFKLSNFSTSVASDQCEAPSGMRFYPDGDNVLFDTDMGYGASLSVLDPRTGRLNRSQVIEIEEQRETGWVEYSMNATAFFVTDKGNPTITEIHVYNGHSAEIISSYSLPGKAPGTDLTIADTRFGEFIYVLSPRAGSVEVLKVNGPGQVVPFQTFNVSKEVSDLPQYIQGMASFIKLNGLPKPKSASGTETAAMREASRTLGR